MARLLLSIALVGASVFPAACATDARPQTWEDVGPAGDVQRLASDPARDAGAMFSDDACVARAEELLGTDADQARKLMKACLRRDDFMLGSRFAEPKWQGIRFERDDFGAILAAELRKGSADDVELANYRVHAPPLARAPLKAPPDNVFLAYVQVDADASQGGVPGVVVRPLTYEATDKTTEQIVHYDLVEIKTGRVVAEDVKQETVKKTTGTRRLATLIDEPLFVALEPGQTMKKGKRYVLLVDHVTAGQGTRRAVRAVALADAQGE